MVYVNAVSIAKTAYFLLYDSKSIETFMQC